MSEIRVVKVSLDSCSLDSTHSQPSRRSWQNTNSMSNLALWNQTRASSMESSHERNVAMSVPYVNTSGSSTLAAPHAHTRQSAGLVVVSKSHDHSSSCLLTDNSPFNGVRVGVPERIQYV